MEKLEKDSEISYISFNNSEAPKSFNVGFKILYENQTKRINTKPETHKELMQIIYNIYNF